MGTCSVLVIDNYDSFTFNLVQIFGSLGCAPIVVRNDAVTLRDVEAAKPDRIVISPGPGTPDQAGISIATIVEFGPKIPTLGVCLGHQCIAEAYGGTVTRARRVVHGKTSHIVHDGAGIFAGLPSPFEAARYHSLVIEEADVPSCLAVSSRSDDGTVMGVRHREFPIEGIQFHPESFMTDQGRRLLANFVRTSGR
ncbi:MAG: aminodeoxychorismate/anthranilate synthase component II [Actinobacteria bacterium]|nr:aminodeoxychorismate/anthranilate synthase component II [Actinomycetota bacterium]